MAVGKLLGLDEKQGIAFVQTTMQKYFPYIFMFSNVKNTNQRMWATSEK